MGKREDCRTRGHKEQKVFGRFPLLESGNNREETAVVRKGNSFEENAEIAYGRGTGEISIEIQERKTLAKRKGVEK